MITCPFCKRTSSNAMDELQRWCSYCQVFIDDVENAPPSVRTAMAHFCREMAEIGTMNADARAQLLRTAEVWDPI